MRDHGYGFSTDPVLQSLDNIELRDAILAYDDDGQPVPAMWPDAEFIVGNPPFLGWNQLRSSLGDAYVDALSFVWAGSVPGGDDLVCYWHEQARRQISSGTARRAGLLATNSIRGGANRTVIDRVKQSGDIFMAWADEPWIIEGAAVRVSIVAQDDGSESERVLDGMPVESIHADLTGDLDLTSARPLREGQGLAFTGAVKGGSFDIKGNLAREMLSEPANVNGRRNEDVVFPWMNGHDLTRRPRNMFLIDFEMLSQREAAQYQSPFQHVVESVRPVRLKNRRKWRREHWWLHNEPVLGMRRAIASLSRFVATPTLAAHRIFVYLKPPTLPDHQLVVIARDDDYAFGVLHSRAHELWSLRMGTSLEDRPRYTPTTTFETFPFPWPLNTPDEALTPEQREHRAAIGAAARELDEKRRLWLNPPEWVREVPDVIPSLPPRLLPVTGEAEKQLRERTLTNLYNKRPTWLANLHASLDAAVFAAYGWPADLESDEMLARLLQLNQERASG